MVQPKYSPEEALHRVKLMMGYDTKKTLKENKEIIFEQATAGEASSIASALWKNMAGDVETEDLEKVQDIFNTQVFGKTFKDGCLLSKVLEYYKGHQGSFAWSLTTTYQKDGFMADLANSSESGEPEFEDIKKDLIDSINKELEGFCKNTKKVEDEKKDEDCKTNPNQEKCKKTGQGKGYTLCTGTYKYACKTDPSGAIGKVQACLGGLVVDGKFGPKTRDKLSAKGFTTFTDADIEKICQSNPEAKPEVGGEVQNVSGTSTEF